MSGEDDLDLEALLEQKRAELLKQLDGTGSDVTDGVVAKQQNGVTEDHKKHSRRQRQKANAKLKQEAAQQAREEALRKQEEFVKLREAKRKEAALAEAEARARNKPEESSVKTESQGKKVDEKETPDEHDDLDIDLEGNVDHASRRERKEAKRISLAALKQLAEKPEVVEAQDCHAKDPLFLVQLKSVHNSVKVPINWSQKRKYLIAKKGYEKTPFRLPKHIEDTGIAEIRKTDDAGESDKLRKQMRERARPKLHRMEISYETLWNAFFVHAKKPPMTQHGEVYYEGREFDDAFKKYRPGKMSGQLMRALGMGGEGISTSEGATYTYYDSVTPPPWLHNMQIHGPPPAYPLLKVPGVNAPIPEGARWGPDKGEWGTPPVDAFGRPLWGDLYGTTTPASSSSSSSSRSNTSNQLIDPNTKYEPEYWGRLQGELDDYEDEGENQDVREVGGAEEEEEEENKEGEGEGGDEMEENDGLLSVRSGMITPAVVQLRRGVDATSTSTTTRNGETGNESKALYTVLEEQQVGVGKGRFGTTFVYGQGGGASGGVGSGKETVLTLSADDLANLDESTIKRKYQEHVESARQTQEAERRQTQRDWEEAQAEAQASKRRRVE